MIWLAVALAGAAGAACRYTVDHVITRRSHSDFPLGTLVVNLSGAFLIGMVAGAAAHQNVATEVRTVAAGGFCGAYTTFSTLVYETWGLIEDGSRRKAMANLATIVLGMAAVAAGWALTTSL